MYKFRYKHYRLHLSMSYPPSPLISAVRAWVNKSADANYINRH